MLRKKYLGTTQVGHCKNTADKAPVRFASGEGTDVFPKEVLLSMSQHIGAPATLTVNVGDEVKVGQPIASAGGYVSSPIHSSVSGKVKKIETLLCSNGRFVNAVRIENDGQYTVFDGVKAPDIHDFDSFRAAVQDSGLVGLGGAGFPTAVKLDAEKKGLIKTVVLNGAECEPYITSDTRTMLDRSVDVREGVKLLLTYISAEECIIGIEKNKPEAIAEMRRVFADDARVTVKELPDTYPQGGEKILIYNTTGRVVPEGKLPADVGVLVMNVTSVAFLAQYARTGMPLVEKCITVDGSAVKDPKNVIVPIGTPIEDVIAFAGGLKEEAGKVLYGGPMMGVAVYSLTDPVLKTTNGLTVLNRKDAKAQQTLACIHCGRCVDACPMGLMPTRINHAMEYDDIPTRVQKLEEDKINLCMECGCCSFVCPSHRPLVQTNRLAKADVREYNARQAALKK